MNKKNISEGLHVSALEIFQDAEEHLKNGDWYHALGSFIMAEQFGHPQASEKVKEVKETLNPKQK